MESVKVPLSKGGFTLIDKRDLWLVDQFTWYEHSTGYAMAGVSLGNGKRGIIKLHRLITGFPPFDLDHINGDGLDNRRRNLRPCSDSENMSNRGKQKNNTSGFKGVSQHKNGKWRAKIWIERRQIHLGYFENRFAAFNAYIDAAKKYHGEFAHA